MGTKALATLKVPIVLNLGVKLTDDSIPGIAATSLGWEFKLFDGAFFTIKAPAPEPTDAWLGNSRQPR